MVDDGRARYIIDELNPAKITLTKIPARGLLTEQERVVMVHQETHEFTTADEAMDFLMGTGLMEAPGPYASGCSPMNSEEPVKAGTKRAEEILIHVMPGDEYDRSHEHTLAEMVDAIDEYRERRGSASREIIEATGGVLR